MICNEQSKEFLFLHIGINNNKIRITMKIQLSAFVFTTTLVFSASTVIAVRIERRDFNVSWQMKYQGNIFLPCHLYITLTLYMFCNSNLPFRLRYTINTTLIVVKTYIYVVPTLKKKIYVLCSLMIQKLYIIVMVKFVIN